MLTAVLDPRHAASSTTFRVRFCETDLMGIVHHATYLVYFEVGRVDWLRRRGVTYASWAARGLHLPVVEAKVTYRAPARFDDEITVETRLAEVRAASVRYEYRIVREGLLLTEGSTRLACLDEKRGVSRLPADVHDVLMRAPDTGMG